MMCPQLPRAWSGFAADQDRVARVEFAGPGEGVVEAAAFFAFLGAGDDERGYVCKVA